MRYVLSDLEWAVIDRIMEALAAARDTTVQMIDTSIVMLHPHGARSAGNRELAGLLPKTMVLADPGYDADWIRALAIEQGARANIAPKRNRRDPICFSPYLYRSRNLVERFFNKLKQCRRIATRYDKLAADYLAFTKLASIRIWLRAYESTP
jgi:transposase